MPPIIYVSRDSCFIFRDYGGDRCLMADTYMLTTVDNPYNPFIDFERWFEFDELTGYRSCEKIDRLTHINDGMSEEEKDDAIEKAIDTIVLNDFTGLYRKVDEKRAKELVEIRLETPNFYEKLDSGELF